MTIRKLRESDYFDESVEMHYALLQTAERVGPDLHTHEFFEIFLLIEGRIEHIVNGRHITLIDGSMTLIRPDDTHYYRPIPGCTCQAINLAIARRAIYDLLAYLGEGFHAQRILDLELPPMVDLTPPDKQRVRAKLEHLHSIPVENSTAKRTGLRILLFELMTQFVPLAELESKSDMPEWLQRSCQEMQKPQNLVHGVPRMLELAAVSPEHLSRTVRKFLRQTPTTYINHLRLNYAANLLTHGDLSIVDIAAEVGFESLSYFYALFKAHYEQTPRQFRRSHQRQLFHGHLQ